MSSVFSGTNWGVNFALLMIFAIGFVIGFFAISKLMDYLLKHFRIATYFVILGLIIGQIVISYFNGEIKLSYQEIPFSIWQVILFGPRDCYWGRLIPYVVATS